LATRLEKLIQGIGVGKSSIDSVMEAIFLKNQSAELFGSEVMSFPYKKSDLVYICISTTTRAISQIPIRVYKEMGDDEWKALPSNDPWQRLFDRPNLYMDRNSFVEATVGHLMHDGDVFIIPFPPQAPIPVSLWVIKKKYCAPIKNSSTGQLIGWAYDPKGASLDNVGGAIITPSVIPLDVEDVCHIYFWNPYDPIMGMAPSEAGRLNITVDFKASTYTGNFLDDGAVPGGMLETERSLTKPQFDRILNQFEARHAGYKRGHRIALLENGLKYVQTGLNQKDMEFSKLRDMTANRIFQIYGMKKAVISETDDVNFATSREQRREWWEGTNLPMMTAICSALNFAMFYPEDSLKCRFDTTKIDALRQSLKEKTDTAYRLWQMGATFNQLNQRLDLGFPKNKWGNTWYMPQNLIDVADYKPPSDKPLLALPPGNPASPPPPVNPPKPKPGKELLEYKDSPANEGFWNTFIKRSLPLEEQFTKKVSRVFFNMRKRTLELLYNKKSLEGLQKDIDDLDKEMFLDEYKELARVTDALYKEGVTIGVELVVTETGFEVSFNLMDPEVLYFLTNKKLKIAGIIQTIKTQIQKEIIESYQTGESIEQIADRIRGVFDIAKSRAKTIARTEMIGSMNEGRALAISRSGFREEEWFTAMDERVRAQHRPMHGKRKKVGEMWLMPDGSALRHPGDYEGPAHQIINCRCISVVVPESHWTHDND
jgi:HK97 family phage portal protein